MDSERKEEKNKEKPPSIVLEVQSVRHVLSSTIKPPTKETKENG